MATTFEVGMKYKHSVNPHCMFAEVLDRTAKTVTVRYGWAYEGEEYNYNDEVEKKVVKTDRDGNEKFGTGFNTYFSEVFEDPTARRQRIEKEIADKKEADRQGRLAIQIPDIKTRDVPVIDQNILMAWTINNDIENLVKYAKRIDTGDVMICANPEYNHATKRLYFDGFEVWVHDGRDDKYTTTFFANLLVGSRDNFEDKFKIEASHTYKYGMTLTAEGVWLNEDGTKWEPDYEYLNY